jgi:phage shock protein A
MPTLDDRVTHLEEQMENQSQVLLDLRGAVTRLDTGVEALRSAMDTLRTDMNVFRADMNVWLERMDQRFERVDERFERNDRKFERIDDKLDRNLMWVAGILMAIVIAIVSLSLQVARL